MEDLIIGKEDVAKLLQEALPKVLKDIFTNSYDNPLKNAVAEEIKNQEGAIKEFVRTIISSILSDNELKIKVANEIIAQLIKNGLKN